MLCVCCVCVLPELPGQGFLPVVCPGTAAGPDWRESAPVCRSSGVRAHQRAPAVGTEMKTDLFIYMKRNIQSFITLQVLSLTLNETVPPLWALNQSSD